MFLLLIVRLPHGNPPHIIISRGASIPSLMYWKIAASAWRCVGQLCRQMSSAFRDLKNVSTEALRLLYLSSAG